MIPENVIPELKAIVGPDHLLTSPEERWGYAYDATDRAAMPEAGGLSRVGGGGGGDCAPGQ